MTPRHALAALALLAFTAGSGMAGLGDSPRAQLEIQKDFPRPMPGFVMPPVVENTWEQILDWFRLKLGPVASPSPMIVNHADHHAP